MNKKYPDYKYVIIDKLTYAADKKNLKHQPEAFFAYDINDEKVFNIFDVYLPGIVVNFCAETHVDNSIQSDRVFWETNVCGTANLLKAYKKYCPESRIVMVSTDEVMGSFKGAGEGYKEDSPIAPTSPYAASKAAAELVTDSYCVTYDLKNVVTVRCTNNYGPHQHKEKLIPKVIFNALQDKPIEIYGAGEQVRDWLYVEDFCRALELLCFSNQTGKFNVSAAAGQRNIDVVKDILIRLGKSDNLIKHIEDPRKNAHDFEYRVDSNLFRQTFNWKPEVSWEQGIDETIRYYKK